MSGIEILIVLYVGMFSGLGGFIGGLCYEKAQQRIPHPPASQTARDAIPVDTVFLLESPTGEPEGEIYSHTKGGQYPALFAHGGKMYAHHGSRHGKQLYRVQHA